jgi:hypothetical protein
LTVILIFSAMLFFAHCFWPRLQKWQSADWIHKPCT